MMRVIVFRDGGHYRQLWYMILPPRPPSMYLGVHIREIVEKNSCTRSARNTPTEL